MKEKSVKIDKKLKMENDEPAKIVLISNEGGRYGVDKNILLRTSDYFQALANSGMRDAHFKELTLECLSDECLHEVKHFLSNVQNNEELCRVEKGLEGSLYLQIESMTGKYLNDLFGLLNESTYVRILQFANKFAVFGAIERVFEFIFDNFKSIVSKSEILSLSPEDMIRLVESEVVNVDREFDIFDLVARWTSVDELRRQYAELLFSKVRYNLMAVDERRKASGVLNELQINVQTEGDGFRTVGTIFAFGAPDIEVIEQPYYSLSTYDFVKILTNKTTKFPFVNIKPTNSRMQSSLLEGYCVCAANNRIYFAGGCLEMGNSTNRVAVYDSITSKWSRLSSMSVARCYFYFGEMGGHLYAVAGASVENMFIQTVERYIPDEDRWYTMAPLPIAVVALSGTACNGMLYASGGLKVDEATVNLMYMYNPTRNQWYEKAPMLSARHCHKMTALGDKIFVVGGYCFRTVNGDYNVENVMDGEMFDCSTEQWTSVLRIKAPFDNPHSIILINSSMYCFSFDRSRLSIQKINLKKFLNGNRSSSNALSDLATNDELKKKSSNVTDDDDTDMKDACHYYEYSALPDLNIHDENYGGDYAVVYA